MENNSKGMPRIDAFHEMLEQERKHLAYRPTRMQKIVFRNAMDVEKAIIEARRLGRAIRL